MSRVIDAKGLACPQPVIKAKDALKETGLEDLEVLVDNEMAVQNLMKLGNYSGMQTSSVKIADGEFKVVFHAECRAGDNAGDKAEGNAGDSAGDQAEGSAGDQAEGNAGGQANAAANVEADGICSCAPRAANTVVALSSDQMGSGDGELGRILMKGFVYALTQMETLPSTVLLYNGGARLAVEGAETLEDLKNLEEQGVEILTCGTCLNYYGLSEKLKVGGVTNMYEIVERMTKAGSVVKP